MTEEEQRYLDTFTGGIKPIHIPDNYVFDPSKGGYVSSENAVNADPVVSSFVESNIGPATTLTPLQQLAQDLQGKIEDVGFDTYKKRDGEYNVRFADGTSQYDQDLLDQYGVSKKDFLGALRGYGNYIGSVGNRLSAGSGFEQGLENILNPEEAQDQFETQISRKRKEKKQKERTDATRKALDTQVAKEALALFPDMSYNDAIDRYYALPFSQRAGMAVSDFGEIFDSSQGELFQNPDAIDPNNPRNLGVLGSESLATAQKKAEDYFNEPVEAFFNIPDVSGAVDDPDYGKGVYTPPDDDLYSGGTYDDLDGALTTLPADAVDFDYPLADGFTIPGTNITITAPDGDGPGAGSNNDDRKGTFSKKRDVYGNPIRLSKGGTSWWKMAANWTNPSERIDTYVTVDEEGNYITSDGRLVPDDLLETALLTPTDIKIKTGTEEYQVPYNDMENYNALYTGEINEEPLPVISDQEFIPK